MKFLLPADNCSLIFRLEVHQCKFWYLHKLLLHIDMLHNIFRRKTKTFPPPCQKHADRIANTKSSLTSFCNLDVFVLLLWAYLFSSCPILQYGIFLWHATTLYLHTMYHLCCHVFDEFLLKIRNFMLLYPSYQSYPNIINRNRSFFCTLMAKSAFFYKIVQVNSFDELTQTDFNKFPYINGGDSCFFSA